MFQGAKLPGKYIPNTHTHTHTHTLSLSLSLSTFCLVFEALKSPLFLQLGSEIPCMKELWNFSRSGL
jgi:hypothetical protein